VIKQLILPTPVLILESDPLLQKRLRTILVEAGYTQEQLICAGSISTAKQILTHHLPSFVLIDIGFSESHGISFIRELKLLSQRIIVLVISALTHQDIICKALESGANGYLLKEREDVEILIAIRNILSGGTPIDPFIACKIFKYSNSTKDSNHYFLENTKSITLLSIRENEVLKLIARGLSNLEIANYLNLSRYTIESHIKNIYRKLSVSNRTKAINIARSMGLLI